MTSYVVEFPAASIDSWQFAWQWSPSLVGALAAAAVFAAVASMRRGLSRMRLVAVAARIVAIALLVVMVSGWSISPKGLPDAEMDRFTPTLAVTAPRVVLVGDAVGIDVEAVLPAVEAGDQSTMADLIDAAGVTVASVPLVEKSFITIKGRPGEPRRGGRFRGRIVWRPSSAVTFSGSVRIRGEHAGAVAPPLVQPVSIHGVAEQLRVFLLDRPRFESRFLSRLFARDERCAVTARLLGQDASTSSATRPVGGAAELPVTREAWSRFDVVVLGAIDPLAIPEPAAAALVEAAVNDGVGIVWSLDAASDAEAIAVSPLGRLLPFRSVSRHPPFTNRSGIRLASVGEDAAWLAIADDAVASREAWRTMPSVYARIEPTAIRPTARVMATCTPLAAVPGAARQTTPFILVDQAGDSRIVAFLAETWRLRQGARGAVVDRLLLQATLHAAEPHFASRVLAATPAGPEHTVPPAQPEHAVPPATSVPRPAGDGATPTARPLWNHPLILLALLAACGVEWWIRERLGDGP